MESLSPVTMFVDGNHAVVNDQWTGGWAYKLRSYKGTVSREKEAYGFASKATNYSMKLVAIAEGIKALKTPCSVLVYVNDETLVNVANSMKEFIQRKGLTKNKKPMAYPELWLDIIEAAEIGHHRLVFKKADTRQTIKARTDTKLIYKS